MASPSCFCQLNCSSPSLPHSFQPVNSSSRTSQTSQISHIYWQLHNFSPNLSSSYLLGNSGKRSSWVCAISSAGTPDLSRSSPAPEFSCQFTCTRSLKSHFKSSSWFSSPRLKASQESGASTETESEVAKDGEEVAPDREVTAAVTVATIASDAGAISKVLETLEKEGAITEEDSVPTDSFISEELAAIYAKCQQWQWKKKYSINYVVQGSGPPVVLVHGFGASIGHWRRNIGVLSQTNKVYAIDLLGLGASEKPTKFVYTMETWAELLIDFMKEIVGSSSVLVGNSIGSLACLIASADLYMSAEAPAGLVRGTVLLNCAGGMNNKAVTDDWRLKLALPLLWLIDFLLNRPSIAANLFNRVKSRANIKSVLQSVYNNKEAVDDELVEVILRPADTPGALDAFVAIITGPPGPKPQTLMPKISNPVLLLWGDDDPFTPIDGPVGKYFAALPSTAPNVQLYLLPNVGHCPHDDRPDQVHDKLVPWLAALPS